MRRLFFVLVRFVVGSICLLNAASVLYNLRFDDLGILLSQLLFEPHRILIVLLGFLFGCLLFAKTWAAFFDLIVKKQTDRFLLFEMILFFVLFLFMAFDYFLFMVCSFMFILIYGALTYEKDEAVIVRENQMALLNNDYEE